MNLSTKLPRYKFSKEAKPDLVNFIRVARNPQNKNCDMETYKLFSQLLPADEALIKESEAKENIQASIIDLPEENVTVNNSNQGDEVLAETDEAALSDLVFSVKENLQMQHLLSDNCKDNLKNVNPSALSTLFRLLEQHLSNEEILYLGMSLQEHINSVPFIENFSNRLLTPRMLSEYSEEISQILVQYHTKFPSITQDTCLSAANKISNQQTKIFLEYIKKLNPKFQTAFVRKFILNLSKLDENSLLIVETLLGEAEYETLNKLVDVLSNSSESYNGNKSFGKLLMNVIEFLGPNLVHVEQPIRRIVAGHKSIWKAKLEKKFNHCYEDSMLFSQSFME